jgi:hypothetical protein
MTKKPFAKKLDSMNIPKKNKKRILEQLILLANLRLEQEIRAVLSDKQLKKYRDLKKDEQKEKFLAKAFKEKSGKTIEETLHAIFTDIEANLETIATQLDENFGK